MLSSHLCLLPFPPHAARPVSWRYWSLPRPAGRRRTLGDLYAISWRPGVCLGVCFPVRGWGLGPCICTHLPALCLLHVRHSGLVCAVCVVGARVCVGMWVWEDRSWALKFPGVKE